jgi:hypothetical protein
MRVLASLLLPSICRNVRMHGEPSALGEAASRRPALCSPSAGRSGISEMKSRLISQSMQEFMAHFSFAGIR